MIRLLFLVLGLLVLAGCLSEVNKPIRPADPWRDRATAIDNVPSP